MSFRLLHYNLDSRLLLAVRNCNDVHTLRQVLACEAAAGEVVNANQCVAVDSLNVAVGHCNHRAGVEDYRTDAVRHLYLRLAAVVELVNLVRRIVVAQE